MEYHLIGKTVRLHLADNEAGYAGDVYNITRVEENDVCQFFYRGDLLICGLAKHRFGHDFVTTKSEAVAVSINDFFPEVSR